MKYTGFPQYLLLRLQPGGKDPNNPPPSAGEEALAKAFFLSLSLRGKLGQSWYSTGDQNSPIMCKVVVTLPLLSLGFLLLSSKARFSVLWMRFCGVRNFL